MNTPCQHRQAQVIATGPGPLPWAVLAPSEAFGDVDLADMHTSIHLGVCAGCATPVVTVRTWDHEHWTAEHGPAWSTAWTPLTADGQ